MSLFWKEGVGGREYQTVYFFMVILPPSVRSERKVSFFSWVEGITRVPVARNVDYPAAVCNCKVEEKEQE